MRLALGVTPPSAAFSEHELVARVRRGEDRAFEELYGRYRRRIGAYVARAVGDHGRAEDVTQEVFISALRRMRETERPIAFKPWIYEIAKNACIDHSRRMRPGQEVSLSAAPESNLGELTPALCVPALESAVESRQKLSDLRGAFGGLSEKHHQILVMRELEGRSYEQIGERLGMSQGMVESTLFRARRKLGEEYEELVSGRRCEFVQRVVADPTAKSFGIRDRRLLARHLSHCQPCRRQAHLAGFDEALLKPASIAARIAALLPFPIWPLSGLWRGRSSQRRPAAWLQSRFTPSSVDALARVAESGGGSVAFGRAAAAVATLALTGVGGGLLATAHSASSSTQQHAITGPGSPAARVRELKGAAKTKAVGPGFAGLGARSATTAGGLASGGARSPAGSVPATAGARSTATQSMGGPGGAPGATAGHGGRVQLPGVHLPKVSPPRVTVPGVNVPKVSPPKVTVPGVNVPKVTLPGVNVPKVPLPKVTLPKVAAPSVPLPKVTLPKVAAPSVPLPKVTLPRVAAPSVPLPKATLPKVPKL